MGAMSRGEARQALEKLAEEGVTETIRVSCGDSYEGKMTALWDMNSGDLSLSVLPGGITFAGVGGGDNRPLIKEALRLLILAIREEESRDKKV